MAEFITKDSGKREDFPSGMRRDIEAGKPRYDLVDPAMLKRWAALMARGAEKYGANNWRKANSQAELDRFRSSAMRHFMQWMAQDLDEDHAAAILFNVAAAEYVKQLMPKQLTADRCLDRGCLLGWPTMSREFSLSGNDASLMAYDARTNTDQGDSEGAG